jgi:hypothetical protein
MRHNLHPSYILKSSICDSENLMLDSVPHSINQVLHANPHFPLSIPHSLFCILVSPFSFLNSLSSSSLFFFLLSRLTFLFLTILLSPFSVLSSPFSYAISTLYTKILIGSFKVRHAHGGLKVTSWVESEVDLKHPKSMITNSCPERLTCSPNTRGSTQAEHKSSTRARTQPN